MDEQPDIVSSEPGPRHPARIVIAVVLVACLGVIAALVLTVVHRDSTITSLRGSLRQAQRPTAAPAQPTSSGSALFTLPGVRLGSYSMVAVAVRPAPGAAARTWIFIYGQRAQPGQRYGLLEGRCGGQFVTPSDLADGTADAHGDLTLEAAVPDVSPAESDIYFQLYRLEDGTPLGGVRGPLVGGGAQTFVSKPSCPSLFSRARVEEHLTSAAPPGGCLTCSVVASWCPLPRWRPACWPSPAARPSSMPPLPRKPRPRPSQARSPTAR